MIEDIKIPLFDLISCLSGTIDLVSPAIANHHKQVAYIALNLAEQLDLSVEQRNQLLIAGALHDVGALSLREKLDALTFEGENLHKHADLGHILLKTFPPLTKAAALIRFHHVHWDEGAGTEFKGKSVPLEGHVLHLSDRISVLIDKSKYILDQVGTICENIKDQSGKMFVPELVDAFLSISDRECFWLDIVSPILDFTLSKKANLPILVLDMAEIIGLTRIFSHIIDFRSRFTATHSSGVAATSKAMARLTGFSERECQMMEIAGYLHDLGKLVIPSEILNKKAKLSREEFNIIKSHTFHTYRSLERIKDFDVINAWASFHHERLNGKGYPFHHTATDLPLGSRIMAVADVFTAITEDRPYRIGMTNGSALNTIRTMADNAVLDAHVAEILKAHFDEINFFRKNAQDLAAKEYDNFFVRNGHERGNHG